MSDQPTHDQVLLVVDMITDYAYPDAEAVYPAAERALPAIVRARAAADAAGVPVVYANDLAGDWRCDRELGVRRALEGRRPDLVRPIVPRTDDVFFFKGQHSAFYGTPLEHMLDRMETRQVVLTGQVTEQCILYSALDAYVRDYEVVVLTDAVAALDDELGAASLELMRRNMSAELIAADRWRPRERMGATGG
jgi:nicotinamidase-related amidase